MAEAQLKFETENQDQVEDRDLDIQKRLGLGTSSSILAGLNLALIISSLSEEDAIHNREDELRETKGISDLKGAVTCNANNSNSNTKIRTRRRQVNEFRAVARQMAKANPNSTKIKDCRHGRKI